MNNLLQVQINLFSHSIVKLLNILSQTRLNEQMWLFLLWSLSSMKGIDFN